MSLRETGCASEASLFEPEPCLETDHSTHFTDGEHQQDIGHQILLNNSSILPIGKAFILVFSNTEPSLRATLQLSYRIHSS